MHVSPLQGLLLAGTYHHVVPHAVSLRLSKHTGGIALTTGDAGCQRHSAHRHYQQHYWKTVTCCTYDDFEAARHVLCDAGRPA